MLNYGHCHAGEDPDLMDNYLVLCKVTLHEAEAYLTAGTIPDGHKLYECSPYLPSAAN